MLVEELLDARTLALRAEGLQLLDGDVRQAGDNGPQDVERLELELGGKSLDLLQERRNNVDFLGKVVIDGIRAEDPFDHADDLAP